MTEPSVTYQPDLYDEFNIVQLSFLPKLTAVEIDELNAFLRALARKEFQAGADWTPPITEDDIPFE